jgi:RND family efflux transporter MFP subunit
LEGLFAQTQESYQSGAASETEFTIAQQRLASQRSVVAATMARRPVLEAQLARGRAEQAAAIENARLRIEESGALEIARAELLAAEARRDEAQLRLARMTVRAPAAGVVMTLHAQAGAKVMLGMDEALSSTIVRLYDPRELQVRVDVPLADAAGVGVGMAAEVIVGVLPDRVFKGRVTRVVNEADVARNTLQVKVAIDDPDPALKPEMLARVRFLAAGAAQPATQGSAALGVFAPESLLRQAEGGATSVLVVDRDSGTAALRQVTLGDERKDGWVEIASGLAAGDRIIVDAAGLEAGGRVRVIGEADLSEGGA